MSESLPEWSERGRIIPVYTEAGPANVLKACLTKWPYITKSPELAYKWCNYYSKETVLQLKKDSVNFIIACFSVGFSIKAEKIQRDLVSDFIRMCHNKGIRVGLYLSWANMFWESMFEDVPESKRWCCLGPQGKPIIYYAETRRRACPNKKGGWWKDLKERVSLALDAGADLIFFDNTYAWCYCRECQILFRKHSKKILGKTYSLPIDPKVQNCSSSILAKDRILRKDKESEQLRVLLTKYLLDEKIRRDYLLKMKTFIKSKRPEVLLSANFHESVVANSACDVFLTETPGFPGVRGKIPITNVLIYKYLFATGKGKKSAIVLQGQRRLDEFGENELNQKLALAEGAAFGTQCCAHQMNAFIHKDYNDFFIANQDCYVATNPVAKIGVLMEKDFPHYVNIAIQINNFPEQLARHNIMFEILLDKYLTKGAFKKYDLLILHNTMILDDSKIRLIKGFVKSGGNLLSCGSPSVLRHDFTRRDDYGLREVFGISFEEAKKSKEKVENRYGSGCSIFYPYQIARMDPSDLSKPLSKIPNEFLSDIKRLTSTDYIEVIGPKCVIVHLMKKDDEGQIIVHVLNYSCRMLKNIKIRLFRMRNIKGKVKLLSPDKVSEKVIGHVKKKDYVEFVMPEILVYSIVIVT